MILERIVAHKMVEVERSKERVPMEHLLQEAQALTSTRGFIEQLSSGDGIRLIAEVKKASPSKGVIREDFHPVEIAHAYESSGASAVSVLTDEFFFQGRLDYLTQIRQAISLPLLRKDFIIDPYQIAEARVAGADAILLIVACLTSIQLAEYLEQAHTLGLDALVEVHSAEELEIALRSEARLIGINNRNLHTFETTLDTTFELLHHIPEGHVVVSESGIRDAADVRALEARGVHAILVGESLMRASDVGTKVRELLG